MSASKASLFPTFFVFLLFSQFTTVLLNRGCGIPLTDVFREMTVPHTLERFMAGHTMVDVCVPKFLICHRLSEGSSTTISPDGKTWQRTLRSTKRNNSVTDSGEILGETAEGGIRTYNKRMKEEIIQFPFYAKNGVVAYFTCVANTNDNSKYHWGIYLQIQEGRLEDYDSALALQEATQVIGSLSKHGVKSTCSFDD